MATLAFTITAMPAAGLKESGGPVELSFSTVEGADLRLTFNTQQLERFAVRAHQLTVLDRIQKLTTAGHAEFHGEGVEAALADASIGGKNVSLILRTPKREVIPYSLTLDQARELHAALGEAIFVAEDEGGQTRQ